jgi:CHAD domain-containing protein
MTTASEFLILQRLRALGRTLGGARQGDVGAIHQTRVATRRLREALPMVVDAGRARKLGRRVRELTRALGPVRELDVVLHTLDALAAASDVPADAVACLRTVVVEERRRVHAAMVKRIGDFSLEKLRRRAVAGARKHDAALAAEGGATRRRRADPASLAMADRRAAKRAAALGAAIDNAAGIYLPDRLHEVRIAVKKLRYAMEVARDLRGSRAVARIRTLKRAQELLGRMHDMEVLIARTRGVQGSPRASDLRLSAHLDLQVRHLENECRRLHGQYIASRGQLVAVCEYVAAFPLRHASPAA